MDGRVGRFAKYLKADDTVLDYACGTGVVAHKIAADVKEVHAIDASAGMIDLANERARALGVTNVHCARKLLKPEGLMVCETPCLGEAGVLMRTLVPIISTVGLLSYLKPFKISAVSELMTATGFQILESEVLEGSIPSSFVVARKR